MKNYPIKTACFSHSSYGTSSTFVKANIILKIFRNENSLTTLKIKLSERTTARNCVWISFSKIWWISLPTPLLNTHIHTHLNGITAGLKHSSIGKTSKSNWPGRVLIISSDSNENAAWRMVMRNGKRCDATTTTRHTHRQIRAHGHLDAATF